MRVAVDLSAEGVDEIRQEEAVQGQLAEDALREFENQMNAPAQRTRPGSRKANELAYNVAP